MIQPGMKALIVEDLPAAREELKALLSVYKDIKIAGETGSVVEAAKLLRSVNPDIVFLDVELEDGSGFDLLEIAGDLDCALIFTTARDDHAVRAFRFAAIDYLLKPVDPGAMDVAISRARQFLPVRRDQIEIALRGQKQARDAVIDRIALHTLERIDIVRLAEIIRCEADGNYSQFYLEGGKKLLVTRTLKDFDRMLAESGFLRVHQSHLVNTDYIQAFNKTDGGYLVLKNGEKIPVSTRRRSFVVDSLQGL